VTTALERVTRETRDVTRRVRRGMLGIVRLVLPGTVGRVLGWSAVMAMFGAFLYGSPASPVALWRADLLLGSGRPYQAVLVYDAVAAYNPMPGIRNEALRRSALTYSVEMDLPREARRRLETLLREPMADSARAIVLERVGNLYQEEGRPLDAARRLREAHDIAPDVVGAPAWLARSARASAAGGDSAGADQSWRRLGRLHPDWQARADLGRADVALGDGRAEGALDLYERAAAGAVDPDIAAVARLGVATCLERLGQLDRALAALDAANLPPKVRERREQSIQERAALR
jgi:tetratricopeptide (TPR) repeat protein